MPDKTKTPPADTNAQSPTPNAQGVQPRPGDPEITPEVVRAHKLSEDEYALIVKTIGREPTFTELGVFSAMWSEHCGYKNSKPLLRTLQSLEDRSARYIRIGQQLDPTGWQKAGDLEHQALLEAMVARDEETAVSLTAHHLERTALLVLADCVPDYVPKAVPTAVAQVHNGLDGSTLVIV